MTIEIHRPELEALIRDWMKTGAFPTVEDALMQALKSSPLPSEPSAGSAGGASSPTGAVVLAALQASPYPEIDLTPPRVRLDNVRDVVVTRHPTVATFVVAFTVS